MTRWAGFDRCEECGADPKRRCRNLDNTAQAVPCVGRPAIPIPMVPCSGCGVPVPVIGMRIDKTRRPWCSPKCMTATCVRERAPLTARWAAMCAERRARKQKRP